MHSNSRFCREVQGGESFKDLTRIESARLLEVLTKHLNMVQIYIEGKGYIIENHGPELIKIVNSLKEIVFKKPPWGKSIK